MSAEVAARIQAVFADIDDTLTTNGRLPAVSYKALETLQQVKLAVVLVTGRPAGWCDMIARFWPVDGVVGENGAFYFSYDAKTKYMRRVYSDDAETRARNRRRLNSIADCILGEVPSCAVSADQLYRETDLAIDFCEDVSPLPKHDIIRIKSIFEEHGATAKISSIHVNGWFGEYDKLSMTRQFAKDVLNMNIDHECSRVVYCGDSPNDEPMFAHFSNACGVANVKDFTDQLQFLPKWVTKQRGGEGFAELAAWLASSRTKKEMRVSA